MLDFLRGFCLRRLCLADLEQWRCKCASPSWMYSFIFMFCWIIFRRIHNLLNSNTIVIEPVNNSEVNKSAVMTDSAVVSNR
jgi:hypothetical protein